MDTRDTKTFKLKRGDVISVIALTPEVMESVASRCRRELGIKIGTDASLEESLVFNRESALAVLASWKEERDGGLPDVSPEDRVKRLKESRSLVNTITKQATDYATELDRENQVAAGN